MGARTAAHIQQQVDLDDPALYLNRGSVTDLAPLAGLSELWAVHLHANQVSDLHPLAGLHKLSLLDLAEDPIGDLAPILALPALSTLDISGTKVDASQIVAIPALRNSSAEPGRRRLAALRAAVAESDQRQSFDPVAGARVGGSCVVPGV